jgi:DNA modification methylase
MIEPYYVSPDGAITIYQGDCLQIMPELEPGSIDAVVTDPPYGLNFRAEAWDISLLQWLPVAQAVAPLVAFTTAPTTQWDYPRPDWVCCWYREAAQSRNVYGGFNHWSPVLIYGKPPTIIRVDSFKINANVHKSPPDIGHPSPKPVVFMRWLVLACSLTNTLVLDPFLGSGTTLVACVQTGRRGIGIEISETYCRIAKERVEKALMQHRLPLEVD